MKKLLFIFFISLGLCTSCVKKPVEDEDPLPPAGNLTADFDSQVFTSTTTDVVVNSVSMTLKASRADGSFFKITLPEEPILGTYTWSVYDAGSPGFYLAYYENADAVPYVGARDDMFEFADFPAYTDTAQLVIYGIDKANKRISGSFKFTGVRFTDDTHSAVETKVFTNGRFDNLPYADAAVVNPNADLLVKKITETAANGSVSTTEYFYSGNRLNYSLDSDGKRTNYLYSGDLLAEEDVLNGTTLIEKTTYSYNASSKLDTYVNIDIVADTGTKITYTHNAGGTISYQEYSGNSSAQEVVGSTGTLSSTRHIENSINPDTLEPQIFTGEFTFDDKNNPFKNIIGHDKIYFADSDMPLNSNNNVLTHTDQIDAEPSYILETMTYTYDPVTNYPTKIVTKNGAGNIQSTEDIIYY